MSVSDISMHSSRKVPRNGAANNQTGGGDEAAPGSASDINLEHFKKLSGILKVVQLILTILLLDLFKPPLLLFIGHMVGIITLLRIFMYMFNIQSKFTISTHWVYLEGLGAIWITVSCLVGGLIAVIIGADYHSDYIPGGLCGLGMAIVGGADCFLLFLSWRKWKMSERVQHVQVEAAAHRSSPNSNSPQVSTTADIRF